MKNKFMTDVEYERMFFDFAGIGANITDCLIEYDMADSHVVLDILSGHGLLAHEVVGVVSGVRMRRWSILLL